MIGRALRAAMPVLWTLAFAVPTAYVVLFWVASAYEVPLTADAFRFERPWAALLLLGAPLVLLAQGYLQRERAPRLLLSRTHDLAVLGRRGWRTWVRHAPTGARVVVTTLAALALMGPQSIHARQTTEVSGIDIVVAIDMSLSMQAADIAPYRFAATKEVVDDFITRRPNDRIGAVVFGQDAYTLMPLTTDKEALRGAIRELQLNMIEGRRTAIGNAVGTALNRLRDSDAASRVIILLTDGDSNAGNISPDQAAEIARTLPRASDRGRPFEEGERPPGVRIYTVLMGQSDETRVQQGTDLFGRPVFGQATVPINPELLDRMAEATGGEAFVATDRDALEESFHTILDRLERSEIEDAGKVYGELYPAFLWPALALLLVELLTRTLVVRRWP